ncbi:MAG: ATPase [Oscillospiraceae bacterium]|nr:ATPase [Oscillospiraceae bacterium]
MNVYDIMDLIDELIDQSTALPFSKGRVIIDAEKLSDLLANIRLNLPTEIKNSQLICDDREEIITNAKKEADNIIRTAEERAKRIVNEQEIVKHAQTKANDMKTHAHTTARETRKASFEFADKALSITESTLTKALSDVREGRQTLKKTIHHK